MKILNINGAAVNVYDDDTHVTLSERVASSLNTLPSFIGTVSLTEKNQNIFDAFREIKKAKDFKDYYKKCEESLEGLNHNDLVSLWISYRADFDEFKIISLKMDLEENGLDFNVEKFLTHDQDGFRLRIESRIQKNKADVLKFEKIIDTIEKLQSAPYYPFKKLKSSAHFQTTFIWDKDEKEEVLPSLDYVFQLIECNDMIPIASYKSMYKYFYEFNPSGVEIESDNETIHFLINTPDLEFIRGYIDRSLSIHLDILYNPKGNEVSNEKFLDGIKKLLTKNFTFLEFTSMFENDLSGLIIFPNKNFNTYIMSDLIMLNDIFIPYLTVDESYKTTKSRSGLYTHFFITRPYDSTLYSSSNVGDGVASILSKKFDSKDMEVRSIVEDKKKLPYGSDIVRLRISRVQTIEVLNKFVKIFSKLLTAYDQEAKNIEKIYKKYIPDFKLLQSNDEIYESTTLKDIVPDLFIHGYAKKCSNPPTIVDEDDLKELEVDQYPEYYMKFPKTPEEGKQYYYTCNSDPDSDKQFIGLRINNLINKDKYNYLPCCYKEDQTVGNTFYNKYINNISDKQETDQQNILITNKLAPKNKFATLPKILSDMLYFLDSSFEYNRKGVSQSNRSFLECILQGLYKEEKSKRAEIEKIVKYEGFSIALQENPDSTIETMIDKFKNPIEYMDPRRWITLLENYYKCKIFIFSRDKISNAIALETPFHKYIHLKYHSDPSLPVLLIYEHYGTDVTLKYPQCELIVKWKPEKSSTVYANFQSIERPINDLYSNTFKQYYYNQQTKKKTKINDIYFPEKLLPHLKHQVVDEAGRTRILITNDNVKISVTPIPPLPIPVVSETSSLVPITPDVNKIVKFLDNAGIYITSQYIRGAELVEITGIPRYPKHTSNPIKLTIKVFDKDAIFQGVKLEKSESLVSKSKEGDTLQDFYNYKIIANALQEFFIYTFSKNTKNISKTGQVNKLIKKYIQDDIVIDQNIRYNIPKDPIISNMTSVFMRNNKIIVDNEETLKRLVYGLLLRFSNDNKNVENYYKRYELFNYYINSQSYLSSNQNIIVPSLHIVQSVQNVIHETLYLNNNGQKYFLRIKNKIYCVIPATNLDEAKKTSFQLLTNEPLLKQKINIKLCIYQSKNDIKYAIIKRLNSIATITILVYKINNDLFYSSLIDL